MSDPSAQRLEDLLVAVAQSAISLAHNSLSLADPSWLPPYEVAKSFKTMRHDLDSLEESICALMRYSGVSWGVLAEYYGVTRQSLHMRMSWRLDERMEKAQRNSDANRDRFKDELEMASSTIHDLEASFDDDLSYAVKLWQARRKKTRWWWDDPF